MERDENKTMWVIEFCENLTLYYSRENNKNMTAEYILEFWSIDPKYMINKVRFINFIDFLKKQELFVNIEPEILFYNENYELIRTKKLKNIDELINKIKNLNIYFKKYKKIIITYIDLDPIKLSKIIGCPKGAVETSTISLELLREPVFKKNYLLNYFPDIILKCPNCKEEINTDWRKVTDARIDGYVDEWLTVRDKYLCPKCGKEFKTVNHIIDAGKSLSRFSMLFGSVLPGAWGFPEPEKEFIKGLEKALETELYFDTILSV